MTGRLDFSRIESHAATVTLQDNAIFEQEKQ